MSLGGCRRLTTGENTGHHCRQGVIPSNMSSPGGGARNPLQGMRSSYTCPQTIGLLGWETFRLLPRGRGGGGGAGGAGGDDRVGQGEGGRTGREQKPRENS